MDTEPVNVDRPPSFLHRLLPVVGPGLLVAVVYVDPGKWAATIDGGARFGYDLVVPMLIFNCAALLCQYLSARIGVVTGRDLAQICSEEYDKFTCILLGVQAAVSVIALDMSLVLGLAHCLNILLGLDLSTGVFLTAIDAVMFPLFSHFMGRFKAHVACTLVASFIVFSYFLGVLFSQTETPVLVNGMPAKLSEESAYALMSLLGASIMPHNFYLHSSFVLQYQGHQNISKDAFCYKHVFVLFAVFSGISVVNYALMTSAASVFNSTGLVLSTLPDAMSLMEQVVKSPLANFALFVILYLTNQTTAFTWNLGGQEVLQNCLRLDIPYWLQHSTIRVLAIAPSLYCIWTSGVEGAYQLLIFSQVVIALMLPSSVIPLFRVSSSRVIMGVHKISQILEFIGLIIFMGLLGLKIIFVVEMIFGNSDWVGNLRWNMGSSASLPHVVLLGTACSSFCLMIWLAVTPLKSATTRLDSQSWNWDVNNPTELPTPEEEQFLPESLHDGGVSFQNPEQLPESDNNSMERYSDLTNPNAELDLPDSIMESDRELHLTTIEENHPDVNFRSPPPVSYQEEPTSTIGTVSVSSAVSDIIEGDSPDTAKVKLESIEPIEKTLEMEGDLQIEKDDDEGDIWESEESSKTIPGSFSSDGPPSFRSLSGKSDEGGNGAGSLSRLAGLGRAARRQLAAVLDEFWGQLFDFHGQPTQEAKSKKLDLLLSDSKLAFLSQKVDASGMEFSGYLSPMGSRGTESLISTSLCDSPKQMRVPNSIDSSAAYGMQRGSSSLWSNHMQLLDAYVQGSSQNPIVDPSERRYYSVRSLPTSEGWDNQPATVHGYQIASIVNRLAKERNSNGPMESPAPMSPSLGPRNHTSALGQNGLSSQIARYQSLAASRNSQLQSERAYYDANSGSVDNTGMSVNTKKFHSLPDISGISGSYRDLYMSEKSNQWNNTVGFGASVGRTTTYEPSFYSTTGSGLGSKLAYDGVSKSYDAFSFPMGSDQGSIWSKQPYEQFGVADKSRAVGSGVVNRSNSIARETVSVADLEARLLQSFRSCIVKLLKLEGSDWLFRQNDGADEDLIDRVAARERCLYEVETREINRVAHMGEAGGITSTLVSSVPHCGDGCVWKADLIVSFGVWCIHRILDLSLMESRPELWGKYTYVLNRLQGIVELAFSKPRNPVLPCFCLQLSAAYQRKSSPPPVSNGMLPPAVKSGAGKGKCTSASMLLDLIKDVEIAISCRKGRSGTAAGDVAFPKGKENLASVLKRYKRRLANKPMGTK